jgi:DNA-binding NtrC family response regulator
MRATILFVDDEKNVLEGLREALWKSEYVVLTATSPEEALELVQRERPDVVVSDYLMPGMTGLAFLNLVRDRAPDTVRLILTGHADTGVAIRAINEGEIYRFLLKPCDRTELLVTLHLACEKLELERENRLLLSLLRTEPALLVRLAEERERVRSLRGAPVR